MRSVILPLVVVQLAGPLFAQDRPEALLRVEEHLVRLETGTLNWTHESPEYLNGTRLMTTQLAGPDTAQIQRGKVQRFGGPVGESQLPQAPSVVRGVWTMRREGDAWMYVQGAPVADSFPRELFRVRDLRTLGLAPRPSYQSVQETLWRDAGSLPDPRRYSVSREGQFDVIRATTELTETTWWLDPDQGGLPVRVARTENGRIVAESRTQLKNFDGVWFPEFVAYYRADYKDGKGPYEAIRVESARFNQPDMPTRLTPEFIGIDAGVSVAVRDEQNQVREYAKWDGEKIVSSAEYDRRERAKELKPGPMYLANIEENRRLAEQQRAAKTQAAEAAGAVGNASGIARAEKSSVVPESEWEAYTRRFMEKYKLNDEQRAQAQRILRDCQERAAEYTTRKSSEFKDYEAERAAIQALPAAEQSARQSLLREREKRLRAPIDEIFETKLKPGLEKLPTRAQRRAAEGTADSEGDTRKP